jgi:hypothetical protein
VTGRGKPGSDLEAILELHALVEKLRSEVHKWKQEAAAQGQLRRAMDPYPPGVAGVLDTARKAARLDDPRQEMRSLRAAVHAMKMVDGAPCAGTVEDELGKERSRVSELESEVERLRVERDARHEALAVAVGHYADSDYHGPNLDNWDECVRAAGDHRRERDDLIVEKANRLRASETGGSAAGGTSGGDSRPIRFKVPAPARDVTLFCGGDYATPADLTAALEQDPGLRREVLAADPLWESDSLREQEIRSRWSLYRGACEEAGCRPGDLSETIRKLRTAAARRAGGDSGLRAAVERLERRYAAASDRSCEHPAGYKLSLAVAAELRTALIAPDSSATSRADEEMREGGGYDR